MYLILFRRHAENTRFRNGHHFPRGGNQRTRSRVERDCCETRYTVISKYTYIYVYWKLIS